MNRRIFSGGTKTLRYPSPTIIRISMSTRCERETKQDLTQVADEDGADMSEEAGVRDEHGDHKGGKERRSPGGNLQCAKLEIGIGAEGPDCFGAQEQEYPDTIDVFLLASSLV